jgi:hypothetical protein
MRVFGVVREEGDLMNCKLDVWSCVAGEVEQHPNSSWVTPVLIKGGSILVRSKRRGSCRGSLGVGVLQTNVLDDFVNEALLGEFNAISNALEVDTQEAKHTTFLFQSQVIPLLLQSANIILNQALVGAQPNLVITVVQDHQLVLLVDE